MSDTDLDIVCRRESRELKRHQLIENCSCNRYLCDYHEAENVVQEVSFQPIKAVSF